MKAGQANISVKDLERAIEAAKRKPINADIMIISQNWLVSYLALDLDLTLAEAEMYVDLLVLSNITKSNCPILDLSWHL